MAHSHSLISKCLLSPENRQDKENNSQRIYAHYRDLLSSLPCMDGCSAHQLSHRHGWFAPMPFLIGAMVAQHVFKARSTDILLATIPKSGTTWLKALLFATVNRNSTHSHPHHTLATLSPHECIPFLEIQVYVNDQIPNLDLLHSPRLFATHIPFHLLPNSVVDSGGCRIVYLCRNPKDNFISLWHFINKLIKEQENGGEPLSLEVGFDRFCNGISPFGPYWDHVLGYWKASLERPDKVLFMRYEKLMEDPVGQLKRMAEFVGYPFTAVEEKGGIVEGIVRLCGFENLSHLEVNKTGRTETGHGWLDNSLLFRRGAVGDWVNYLTSEMAQRLDEITEGKFRGSGLTF